MEFESPFTPDCQLNDLPEVFSEYLSRYKDFVKNILIEKLLPVTNQKHLDDVVKEIEFGSNNIQEFLKELLKGDKLKANSIINNQLESLYNDFPDPFNDQSSFLPKNSTIFRVSAYDMSKQYEKRDLCILDFFHPPFSKREYVRSGRWNSNGIPVLYCSTNLITACCETGILLKQRDAKSNFSCYSNSLTKLALYDFSFIRWDTLQESNSYQKLEFYSILFPLVAALHCSVLHPPKDVHFRVDHQISIFLLQWLVHQKEQQEATLLRPFICLKYDSVRNFGVLNKNIAFIPTFNTNSDYCELLQDHLCGNSAYFSFNDDIISQQDCLDENAINRIQDSLRNNLKH